MVSEAMLLVERSFGTGEKEERSSSSCGSEKVSHEGDEGKADGKMQEKRKERPELKVVICKDGRSSARVGHIFSCPSSSSLKCGLNSFTVVALGEIFPLWRT